ncbi:peptidoglycan-binding protein LysM [Lactobacillus sp. PV037]|uniref:aggregation-promoting factor C-terminal-like domain-containing protein n=1 Tax=unclassified Lactobacillus TaxID=2620435 RepID=UPI00223ECB88|nr:MULTISPECIES: peptidoglycan-binding protein LysM [unclassified Lactobacillus]QNQ82697.1 peptidoglycan-binding protein LysM [Lactobacillus sp. PV012]QNQ83184.1 peptidoglycan-binding protein LysM [Lactobacillus sp. PV037]
MNQFKSVLVKLSAGVALTIGLGAAVTATQPATNAQAATTLKTVGTIKISNKNGTQIWTNYQGGKTTGSKALYNAKYKVTGTATDQQGRSWYAIGTNQWILASNTKKVTKKTPKKAKTTTTKKTVSQAPSNAETAAKNWIAMRESGGSYSARNGQYIGKYQLAASYLHGDYSAANQERVANNYVKSRYGSWVNAKNFWVSHGWY